MAGQKLEIYDTTLRDGAQSEGISFSVNDKLKVIKLLDELGIDYIEGGWPGANPKDIELFNQAKKLELENSTLTAFGCTRKANTNPEDDLILRQLLEAETNVITIFGKTWDFHVEHALCTTLDENIKMISDSVAYLKNQDRRVFFDAEHFYDGFKNNRDYALKTLKAAFEAGAERIILCDTNGGATVSEIKLITETVKEFLPQAQLGIHAHNDSDLAVANSLTAVETGAIQIQGTFNGYGERCGNANLCSIIPTLQLKMGYEILADNIKNLVYVSKQIAEIANVKHHEYSPYVGESAFSHKGGVHASGVRKHSKTYEHVNPSEIGNSRKILISDQSGVASIKDKVERLNLDFELNDKEMRDVLKHIKDMEWQGFTFEDASASFELMIRHITGKKPRFFELKGFRVMSDTTTGLKTLNTEASVKVKIGDEVIHTVSEGEGPGHALDQALRKALRPIYPVVKHFKLSDFKVRILDSTDGTSAKTRVHVETSDGFNRWDTVGVSRNIIEATYLAIVDSIDYGLLLYKQEPHSGYHEPHEVASKS